MALFHIPFACFPNIYCPYDRLFDSGLITFDRQGKIFLSSFIGEENVKRLNLSKGLRFDLGISGNMGEYLDYHNDVLFVK